MKTADVRQDVLSRLQQWRRRLLLQRLVITASAISVLVATALLLDTPKPTLYSQCAVLILVFFAHLFASGKWRRLTSDNFLRHLNRRLPAFEESAHLLIQDDSALSVMQRLQRQRAQKIFTDNLARVEQWQPQLRYRSALGVMIVFALVAMGSEQLRALSHRLYPEFSAMVPSGPLLTESAGIDRISIKIRPPEYTGLQAYQTNTADLEVVEGSDVFWNMAFTPVADSYAIEFSDGKRIELKQDEQNHWLGNATISKTDLYRVTETKKGQESSVGDIYSVKVTLDQPPGIRVMEPEVSMLEIPRNGQPVFHSRVLINDDYGVQSVEILASLAKGSGEGVKFRDQTLTFDQFEGTDEGVFYQREWDLPVLGMEPGDEIYFTVLAMDNKQPVANTGRSATLIVRWLEDEATGLAAEGLAIDFIPEFFKSQRQIIIDTEQLLEDQKDLAIQQFKDTSYEIGQAQADLKQKYGQYLGDEFGEGPGEQLGIMHEIAESHADESNQAEGHKDDDHQQTTAGIANKNLTTTADIVKLFGHDHGDPEVGPITRRNPVGLMKRAVNEMWQAEKHLMQAEPDLALPYEYEAYRYLKLARQADRIYVQRLGFEPPPVTEDRRLSGELDEILTYHVVENHKQVNGTGLYAIQQLLRQTYQVLSSQALSAEISVEKSALLSRMSAHLMTLSQKRPALIQQAATIEKLLLNGDFNLDGCKNCIRDLKQSLWNLMDEGDALLHHPAAVYYEDDALIKAYQEELRSSVNTGESTAGLP